MSILDLINLIDGVLDMGSWTATCSLSGLPIMRDDEVYLLPLKYKGIRRGAGETYPTDSSSVSILSAPIHGQYDEYGGISVSEKGASAALFLKTQVMGRYTIAHERPDNFDALSDFQKMKYSNTGIQCFLKEDRILDQIDLASRPDHDLESPEYMNDVAIIKLSEGVSRIVPKSLFKDVSAESLINDFIERDVMVDVEGNSVSRLGFIFFRADVYERMADKVDARFFDDIPPLGNPDDDLVFSVPKWSTLSDEVREAFKQKHHYLFEGKEADEAREAEMYDWMSHEKLDAQMKYAQSDSQRLDMLHDTGLFSSRLYRDFRWLHDNGHEAHIKPLQHAFRVMFIIRELAHDLGLNLYPRTGKGGSTFDFELQKQLAQVTLDVIAAEEARREEW